MTRQARIDAPGATHHIIARGIEGRKVFLNKKDYAYLVEPGAQHLFVAHPACLPKKRNKP
jgi:hypothetical protein